MRNLLFVIFLLGLTGCLEPAPEAQTTKVPVQPPPAEPMLKTQGCSVFQTNGVVKIECADGSKAEAGVPRYHIKDASGTSLTDLMFLQNWGQVGVVAVNKRSGNVLAYDSAGNVTKITRTLYESADCSGQAYAYMSDFVIKNKVMANSGAAQVSVEAFRVVGYVSLAFPFGSKFEGGVCTGHSGSAPGAVAVEPTQFDDTDPVAIGLPVEIVFDGVANE